MRSPALLLIAALAAGACAPATTDLSDRDAAILRALAPCQRRFPRARILGVDDKGVIQVHVSSRGDLADFYGLQRCSAERLANAPELRPLVSGEVAASSGPSTVPLHSSGSSLVVGVSVNGVEARMILDTGASLTVLSPRLAGRAGITPTPGGAKTVATVVGGRTLEIPLARIKALAVGPSVVENLQVGVYDVLPNLTEVDGLLGANFLDHFKVTIDRPNRRLSLEPSRPIVVTVRPGPVMGRLWPAPVLLAGDRWLLRWQGPSGSGTVGFTVEGEESVNGVAHDVLRSGATRFYYVKPGFALHLQKENDVVIVRHEPPGAYDWPLQLGKQWEQTYRYENARTGRNADVYLKCLVAAAPTITVAAGTFETALVVCVDRDERVMSETWYSDVVKYPVQQRQWTPQGSIQTELVNYSVGRAP